MIVNGLQSVSLSCRAVHHAVGKTTAATTTTTTTNPPVDLHPRQPLCMA